MSNTKKYSNAPAEIAEELQNSVAIDDFLPSPEAIAQSLKKQETVPVTMKLKKDTVERYKRYAAKGGIKYPDLCIDSSGYLCETPLNQIR